MHRLPGGLVASVVSLLIGLQTSLSDSWNEPNMIDSNMLKSTSYEDIIQYNIAHPHSNVWEKRRREKRQAIKGTSRKTDVTLTNKDDIFHGPEVEVPDISFRDMASFVNEAQKTIEDRFENLEREIYKSRARQVCEPDIPSLTAASPQTDVGFQFKSFRCPAPQNGSWQRQRRQRLWRKTSLWSRSSARKPPNISLRSIS